MFDWMWWPFALIALAMGWLLTVAATLIISVWRLALPLTMSSFYLFIFGLCLVSIYTAVAPARCNHSHVRWPTRLGSLGIAAITGLIVYGSGVFSYLGVQFSRAFLPH